MIFYITSSRQINRMSLCFYPGTCQPVELIEPGVFSRNQSTTNTSRFAYTQKGQESPELQLAVENM